MATEAEYDAIARGLLRPERRELDALRARLADVYDAQEAWEIAAPVGWVGDARRRFEQRGAVTDAPPSVASVLAACSDPRGVVRAEALAREALARLAPFGARPRDAVVWSFWARDLWDRGIVPPLPRGPALARAEAALNRAAERAPEAAHAAGRRVARHAPVASVAHLAFLAAWWDARGAELPANPFEPLLALLGAGYWVHRLEDAEGGSAVALVMPTE